MKQPVEAFGKTQLGALQIGALGSAVGVGAYANRDKLGRKKYGK